MKDSPEKSENLKSPHDTYGCLLMSSKKHTMKSEESPLMVSSEQRQQASTALKSLKI